jgi:Flp pilus assembly protein TadD
VPVVVADARSQGSGVSERATLAGTAKVVCALLAATVLLSACATLDRLPIPGRSKKAEPPTATSPTSSAGGTISNTPTSAPPTASPSDSPAAPPKPAPTVDEKGRSLFGFGRKKKAAPPPETAGTAAPKVVAVPPQARTEFDRAVGLMRSGKDVEAQLEFARIAKAYPQLAAPDVNLGILYRKANNLEKSEEALQEAVSRDRDSAVAWNELGVTQRQRGDFKSAQDSYENAIRVDPEYAPAYRNLGVLQDLYLGDAEAALENFERYKELSKEEKPVTGWIAELRARTGKPPIRNKPVAPASDSAPGEGSNDNGAAPEVSSDGAPPADGAASDPAASPANGATIPGNGNEAGPAASSPQVATPAEPKRG